MNPALAIGLLLAALALAFAFTSTNRAAVAAFAALLGSAVLGWLSRIGPECAVAATTGCSIAVAAAAAFAYLPRRSGQWAAMVCGAGGGALAGLTLAASQQSLGASVVFLWLLLWLPARWLVARGQGIAVKVSLGWLAAAAVLSLGLNMAPTLGYEPEHME